MPGPPLPATAFVSDLRQGRLETAWNGSGYFRQAMATLGVTLFVTDGRQDLTDKRVWRFPRIEGNLILGFQRGQNYKIAKRIAKSYCTAPALFVALKG